MHSLGEGSDGLSSITLAPCRFDNVLAAAVPQLDHVCAVILGLEDHDPSSGAEFLEVNCEHTGRGEPPSSMTVGQEYAWECVRLAEVANNPDLRDLLLPLAREKMAEPMSKTPTPTSSNFHGDSGE